MTVRTRFAPSPTGYLHLGGARTALYSWAYARHFGGTFILRIEDTDLERSTPEAVQAILDGMQWLGLEHDEGPFYQMKRMDRYREVVQGMLAAGTAYQYKGLDLAGSYGGFDLAGFKTTPATSAEVTAGLRPWGSAYYTFDAGQQKAWELKLGDGGATRLLGAAIVP